MRLRLVCWNVHGCVGRDARFDPLRIARAIAAHDPDVAMLQEVGDLRGIHPPIDQATVLAAVLGMSSHIAVTVPSGPFGYGDVTLTRPGLAAGSPATWDLSVPGYEPRACLALGIGPVLTANVHLGLGRAERRAQLATLLARLEAAREPGAPAAPRSVPGPGRQDLRPPEPPAALILAGDFNDWPPGVVSRSLGLMFRDAALETASRRGTGRPAPTFPTALPLLRLDRIYFGGAVLIRRCAVDRTPLARGASDHLMLVAEAEVSS